MLSTPCCAASETGSVAYGQYGLRSLALRTRQRRFRHAIDAAKLSRTLGPALTSLVFRKIHRVEHLNLPTPHFAFCAASLPVPWSALSAFSTTPFWHPLPLPLLPFTADVDKNRRIRFAFSRSTRLQHQTPSASSLCAHLARLFLLLSVHSSPCPPPTPSCYGSSNVVLQHLACRLVVLPLAWHTSYTLGSTVTHLHWKINSQELLPHCITCKALQHLRSTHQIGPTPPPRRLPDSLIGANATVRAETSLCA